MNLRRRLDIAVGPCPWERPAAGLLAGLGAVSILAAPMAWSWKPVFLVLLLLAWRWAERDLRAAPRALLTLYPDGTAAFAEGSNERPAMLTGRAWLSRPLCLFEVLDTESGDARWCRACAASNASEDYRRLRGLLRLQPAGRQGECLD